MANVAKDGAVVEVEYTGTLDDGSVFDSSKGRSPLRFTVGKGEVIRGFDQAVRGMNVGDKKKIHIPSADAYGDANPALLHDFPRSSFPPGTLEGAKIWMQAKDGSHSMPARVDKIVGDVVTLDLNHPLAGKALNFEIELVKLV